MKTKKLKATKKVVNIEQSESSMIYSCSLETVDELIELLQLIRSDCNAATKKQYFEELFLKDELRVSAKLTNNQFIGTELDLKLESMDSQAF